MFNRTPLVLVALGTTLSLSACGSSGLARADLAKKADAICNTAKTAAAKVTPPSDIATNPDAAASYLGKIQPITRKEATDLAALKPDSDAKADYQSMVDNENKLADYLDGIVKKAKAKDPSGVKDLANASTIAKPFVDAANKIGAKGCAGG